MVSGERTTGATMIDDIDGFDGERALRWEEVLVPPQRMVFSGLAGFGAMAIVAFVASGRSGAVISQQGLVVALGVMMGAAAVLTAMIDLAMRRFGPKRAVEIDERSGTVIERTRVWFGTVAEQCRALAEVGRIEVTENGRSLEDPEYDVTAWFADGTRLRLTTCRNAVGADAVAARVRRRTTERPAG